MFRIHHLDKIEVLARVLQATDRGLTMVFCQTRRMADQVAGALETRGFAVASVHGDLGQGQRERALRAFRNGKVDVLVATDVAARGLDVDDVTHVVNYECPEDDKAYLHRTGRTGRAGRTGIAVTFVDWRDMHRWKLIDESLGLGCAEPTETYSTSENLFGALRIPETVTGTLPAGQRDRAGLGAEAIEDIGETGRVRSQRTQSLPGRGRTGRAAVDRRRQERGLPGPRHPGRRRRPRQVRPGESPREGQGADGSARTGKTRTRVRRRTRRGQDVSRGQRQVRPSSGMPQAARRLDLRRCGGKPMSLGWPPVSAPRSIDVPAGVRRITLKTARGRFAALEAMPATGVCERRPALLVPGFTGSKEDFLPILHQLAAAARRGGGYRHARAVPDAGNR